MSAAAPRPAPIVRIPRSHTPTQRRIALCTSVTLMFVSAAPLPVFTTTQPGSAATMSIDLAQAQAAGQPIFDCSGLQSTAARLKAGLPVQNEWIRRTEEQLKAAREGVQQSKEALQGLALKTARDLAVHQLKMVRDLQTAIENARGYSSIARAKWLARVDTLKEGADAIEKLANAGKAGADLGTAISKNRGTLEEFVKQVNESGISDELGLKAAEFAGPVGVAVVETFVAARDASFALWEGKMSADELNAAQRNLDQMRAARQAVESRAYELDGIVASECAPKAPAPKDRVSVQPAEPPAPPPPAATPVPPPAKAPAAARPAKSGGGGTGVGVLLGLAVAGGAGYYVYNKSKTCVAPTSNILAICSQSSSSSACKTALADQDAFCKCSGYSGFNATYGSCQ